MPDAIPHDVRAQFQALLLERVLAPMEDAFGDFGSIVVAACARSIAEHSDVDR